MSKRRNRGQTMAEILQDVRAMTPTAPQDSTPWDTDVSIQDGAGLPGPDGRVYHRVQADISAGLAQSLVEAGALVAWDGCGCSSSTCLTWLDDGRRQALVSGGRPDVRRRARRRFGLLSQWHSTDGVELVIAECDVRWGHELG